MENESSKKSQESKERKEKESLKEDIIKNLNNPDFQKSIQYLAETYPNLTIRISKIPFDNEVIGLIFELKEKIRKFEAKMGTNCIFQEKAGCENNIFTYFSCYKGKFQTFVDMDINEIIKISSMQKKDLYKSYLVQVKKILEIISQNDIKLVIGIKDLKYDLADKKLTIIADENFLKRNLKYYNLKTKPKKNYYQYFVNFWILYMHFQMNGVTYMNKIRLELKEKEKIYNLIDEIKTNVDEQNINDYLEIFEFIKSLIPSKSNDSCANKDIININEERKGQQKDQNIRLDLVKQSYSDELNGNLSNIIRVMNKMNSTSDLNFGNHLSEEMIEKIKTNKNSFVVDILYFSKQAKEYVQKIDQGINGMCSYILSNNLSESILHIENSHAKNNLVLQRFNLFSLIIHSFDNLFHLDNESIEKSNQLKDNIQDLKIDISILDKETQNTYKIYLLYFFIIQLLFQIKIFINRINLLQNINYSNFSHTVEMYIQEIQKICISIKLIQEVKEIKLEEKINDISIIPKKSLSNLKFSNNDASPMYLEIVHLHDASNILKQFFKEENKEENFDQNIERKNVLRMENLEEKKIVSTELSDFCKIKNTEVNNDETINVEDSNEKSNLEDLKKLCSDFSEGLNDKKLKEKVENIEKQNEELKKKFNIYIKELRLQMSQNKQNEGKSEDSENLIDSANVFFQHVDQFLKESKQNKKNIKNLTNQYNDLKNRFDINENYFEDIITKMKEEKEDNKISQQIVESLNVLQEMLLKDNKFYKKKNENNAIKLSNLKIKLTQTKNKLQDQIRQNREYENLIQERNIKEMRAMELPSVELYQQIENDSISQKMEKMKIEFQRKEEDLSHQIDQKNLEIMKLKQDQMNWLDLKTKLINRVKQLIDEIEKLKKCIFDMNEQNNQMENTIEKQNEDIESNQKENENRIEFITNKNELDFNHQKKIYQIKESEMNNQFKDEKNTLKKELHQHYKALIKPSRSKIPSKIDIINNEKSKGILVL